MAAVVAGCSDFEVLRSLAWAGHGAAQAQVAQMYAVGQGVEKDVDRAISWFRRGAKKGDPESQYGLWILSSSEENPPGVRSEGLHWLHAAADQDYAIAQAALGGLYLRGDGVERDRSAGIVWIQKAADNGDLGAQNDIAVIYSRGLADDLAGATAQERREQALEYLRMAARAGFAPAQNNLGLIYLHGGLGEPNPVLARLWLSRAAAQEYQEAKTTLESLGAPNPATAGER